MTNFIQDAVAVLVATLTACASPPCDVGSGAPEPADAPVYAAMPDDPAWGPPGYAVEVTRDGVYTLSWNAGPGVLGAFSGSVFALGFRSVGVSLERAVDYDLTVENVAACLAVRESPGGMRLDFGPIFPSGGVVFRVAAAHSYPAVFDLLAGGSREVDVFFTSPVPGVGNVSPDSVPFALKPALDAGETP